MKVLLEGLFVAVVLFLEAVGLIVLGRSTLATETYTLASPNAAPTAYFFTSEYDKDGGAYWLEWEDTSCALMMGVPGKEGDLENFEVRRSGKEVVGIGEAAGCRGKLVPYVANTRHPGVRPPGGGH